MAIAPGQISFWGDPGDSLPAMSSAYVDCDILPKLWDDTESIRDRLRDGLPLVNCEKGADVKIGKCVVNHELLIPILNQIAEGCRIAEIDPLRDACEAVYKKCSRTVTASEVDEAAWGVRDLVTFVKRKAQREEVSLEFRLTFMYWIFFMLSTCMVIFFRQTSLLYIWHPFFLTISTSHTTFGCSCSHAKDPVFQSLCLIVNPELEARQGLT